MQGGAGQALLTKDKGSGDNYGIGGVSHFVSIVYVAAGLKKVATAVGRSFLMHHFLSVQR